MIELDDVRAAAARIAGVAHRTPVLTSRTLDERTGGTIFLKPECLQRAGAFKFRGAYNRMAALAEAGPVAGVAAFSSGNHAQAVALAGRLLGIPAVIVMPADTPAVKLEATRGYGAEIVLYDRYSGDRVDLARSLAGERGLELVPPYDNDFVMAGQGTAALELIEDAGPLDVLVVPVGGGGLIAGCATAAKGLRPETRVVGVEPEAGDDLRQSLARGERVEIPVPRTIADGLQASVPGEVAFPVNVRRVDEVVTATDDEILRAMAFLFDRLKLVTEPSGAIGLAAVLEGRVAAAGRRVGIVVSGGNVGLARFCELLGGAG